MRELFEVVGLRAVALTPAADEALSRAGASKIVDLAAGVYAVGLRLTGRERPVVQARALTSTVALQVGLSHRRVAEFLGVSRQTAGRLARRRADPKAIHALRVHLALEERTRTDHASRGPGPGVRSH